MGICGWLWGVVGHTKSKSQDFLHKAVVRRAFAVLNNQLAICYVLSTPTFIIARQSATPPPPLASPLTDIRLSKFSFHYGFCFWFLLLVFIYCFLRHRYSPTNEPHLLYVTPNVVSTTQTTLSLSLPHSRSFSFPCYRPVPQLIFNFFTAIVACTKCCLVFTSLHQRPLLIALKHIPHGYTLP